MVSVVAREVRVDKRKESVADVCFDFGIVRRVEPDDAAFSCFRCFVLFGVLEIVVEAAVFQCIAVVTFCFFKFILVT